MTRFGSVGLLSVLALSMALASCAAEAPMVKSLLREGERCGADEECQTGLCVALRGEEKVCRRTCESGCRDGEICTTFGETANGGMRAGCVPEKPGLCQLCATGDDCAYVADACLLLGSERFCGRDCSFDGKCSEGYVCTDSGDAFGSTGKQCQPKSGTCACTPATAGQTRPCEARNSFGVCRGTEVCDGSTFARCDALVPAAEVCNGIDDDCNGEIDEGFEDIVCGLGECQVVVPGCENGRVPRCEARAPGVETCDGRDEDCDGVIDNGFDVTTLENCGACGNACAPVAHGTPVCAERACAIGSCEPGWADCDGRYETGCEVQPGIDLQHCGGCGRACAPANAEPDCDTGVCRIVRCLPGFADCDGEIANGCEVDLTRDDAHCGGCGNRCVAANGTSACEAGQCVITGCAAPFQDCDGLYATGCESNGARDLLHCGGCGLACPVVPGATTTCDGACGYTCHAGLQDCDGLASSGCESNRATDLENCGACNMACPDRPNSNRTCDGTCGFVCKAGYKDCNLDAVDGCESRLSTDVRNCGACGRICGSIPNATPGCSGGNCAAACRAGWADCDGSYTSGCERKLNSLPAAANCSSPVSLGELAGDKDAGSFQRVGGAEAVFTFKLMEKDTSLFTRVPLSARFTLKSPPGVMYDVYVSHGACGQNQAQYSPSAPGGTVAVKFCKGDKGGSNDDVDMWVEVVYRSGTGCGNWTLTVEGNTDPECDETLP